MAYYTQNKVHLDPVTSKVTYTRTLYEDGMHPRVICKLEFVDELHQEHVEHVLVSVQLVNKHGNQILLSIKDGDTLTCATMTESLTDTLQTTHFYPCDTPKCAMLQRIFTQKKEELLQAVTDMHGKHVQELADQWLRYIFVFGVEERQDRPTDLDHVGRITQPSAVDTVETLCAARQQLLMEQHDNLRVITYMQDAMLRRVCDKYALHPEWASLKEEIDEMREQVAVMRKKMEETTKTLVL